MAEQDGGGTTRGNPAFGRDSCEKCNADLDVIPYTLGTVECPECGHGNMVAT